MVNSTGERNEILIKSIYIKLRSLRGINHLPSNALKKKGTGAGGKEKKDSQGAKDKPKKAQAKKTPSRQNKQAEAAKRTAEEKNEEEFAGSKEKQLANKKGNVSQAIEAVKGPG